MRKAFSSSVVSKKDLDSYFFLTGDLGYMALEDVEKKMAERFINAGVAEQNMIGVAGGLAREGFKVIVYSIAPFCYARPFEQIRNDLCLSQLPVCLVGNGGGYAYGHMGPTHHALEDCAAMKALGVRVLVPAFDADIEPMLEVLESPTYLRLGYDARPSEQTLPKYAPWREVLHGKAGAIAALGPLAGVAWGALLNIPADERPAVWAVTEFNSDEIPDLFWNQIENNRMFVIEEHVAEGGLGAELAYAMIKKKVSPSHFTHRYALRYPSGRFGSQDFHRRECGIDAASITTMLEETNNEQK